MSPTDQRRIEQANGARIRKALARGAPVVVGRPVELSSSKTTVRLAVTPSKNIPGATSADVAKKIRAIAQILEVPEPLDVDKVRAAFDDLLASESDAEPASIAAAGRRLGLSTREIAHITRRRIDPKAYLAAKRSIGGASKRMLR